MDSCPVKLRTGRNGDSLPLTPRAHRGRAGIDGVRGDEPVAAAPARLAAAAIDVEPQLITSRLSRPGPVVPERRALGLDGPLENRDDRAMQGANLPRGERRRRA